MATHLYSTLWVFLPRESHGERSLLGYSPWGCKESDMTYWLNHHHHIIDIFSTFIKFLQFSCPFPLSADGSTSSFTENIEAPRRALPHIPTTNPVNHLVPHPLPYYPTTRKGLFPLLPAADSSVWHWVLLLSSLVPSRICVLQFPLLTFASSIFSSSLDYPHLHANLTSSITTTITPSYYPVPHNKHS